MRKITFRLLALVLAVVMVLPLATSCGKKKSPLETIEAAIENSADAMAEGAFSEAVKGVYEGGSAELKVELGPLFAMLLGSADPAFNLSASLKTYADILNGKSALAASVSTGGVSLADLLLTVADKSVSVSSSALFGSDVYGFSTENFAENFNKSEFGENGACSLGITAEEVDSLIGTFMTSLTDYAKAADEMLQYQKTLTDASDALKADLYPTIESHGTIETLDGTLSVGGKDVTTDDIVFTYTGDQLEALLTDVLTLLRDHESIRPIFETLSDYYTEVLTSVDLTDFTVSVDVDSADFSVDDILAEYTAQIDELLLEVDSVSEEMADATVALAVHISKSAKEVIGISFDADENGEYVDVRFVCGPSAVDIDEISLSVKTSEGEDFGVVYMVETDDENTYVVKLSANEDGDKTDIFSLELDKTGGEYVLSVTAEGQSIGLGGTYVEEKDSLTITATSISVSGVSINFGEIAMIFRANDPMPTNGAYTDVLTMRAEEIEAVAQDIVTAFEEIASVFGG